MFLQVFDDGRLTASKGFVVDFSNSVIILTSNLGFSSSSAAHPTVDQIKSSLAARLGPEFVGRIQNTIVFKYLNEQDVEKLIDLTLQQYSRRFTLGDVPMQISIEPEAKKLIVQRGYEKAYGARSVTTFMDKQIVEQLTQLVTSRRATNPEYFPKMMKLLVGSNDSLVVELESVFPGSNT